MEKMAMGFDRNNTEVVLGGHDGCIDVAMLQQALSTHWSIEVAQDWGQWELWGTVHGGDCHICWGFHGAHNVHTVKMGVIGDLICGPAELALLFSPELSQWWLIPVHLAHLGCLYDGERGSVRFVRMLSWAVCTCSEDSSSFCHVARDMKAV